MSDEEWWIVEKIDKSIDTNSQRCYTVWCIVFDTVYIMKEDKSFVAKKNLILCHWKFFNATWGSFKQAEYSEMFTHRIDSIQ